MSTSSSRLRPTYASPGPPPGPPGAAARSPEAEAGRRAGLGLERRGFHMSGNTRLFVSGGITASASKALYISDFRNLG